MRRPSGLGLLCVLLLGGCAKDAAELGEAERQPPERPAQAPIEVPAEPPIADMHTHWRWNQKEIFTAEDAVKRLRAHNVRLAVVAGWPSPMALELREAGGEWIYPFFTPYIKELSRYNWWEDDEVLARARAGLEKGSYYGIGELHMIGGQPPARDNRIFQGLLDLAAEFNVPMLIHTEASSYKYLLPICQQHAEVRFQWAHAGGYYQGPEEVAALMEACPNVWVELSGRDPWRYGNFATEDGRLPDAWAALLQRYPERFMIGSDPVYPGHTMYHFDSNDTGWDKIDQFIAYHRRWLDRLPPDLARKIRLTNGYRFLGLEPPGETPGGPGNS